jgi:hypothetical protein
MGRNVMEERRELSLMDDYIMRFEACIYGQLLLHKEKKERRFLNGKRKRKKRPLLNFGACKITFLFLFF